MQRRAQRQEKDAGGGEGNALHVTWLYPAALLGFMGGWVTSLLVRADTPPIHIPCKLVAARDQRAHIR